MSEVERLREAAENTTPGRWKLWGMSVLADQDGTGNVDTAVPVASTHYRDENGKPRTWDADWIFLTQPDEVLALLDRLEAAEAALGRVEALADEWEALADYVNDPASTTEQRARSRAGVIAAEQLRAALAPQDAAGDGS